MRGLPRVFVEVKMKISVGRERPAHFTPAYPEEFALFSHLEELGYGSAD